MFVLALACIGFMRVYRKSHLLFMAFLLAVPLVSFFFPEWRLYANVEIAVLSSLAIWYIAQRKFTLSAIRDFSLILILCGVLFGSVSYADRLILFPPDTSLVDSLSWANENLPLNAVILSHPDNGFWIRQIAKRQPVVDALMVGSKHQKLHQDVHEVWYSWDLTKTKEILTSLEVTHILVTHEMLEESVWIKPEQGLHFLFKNIETFKKLHQVNTTEVWQYLATE